MLMRFSLYQSLSLSFFLLHVSICVNVGTKKRFTCISFCHCFEIASVIWWFAFELSVNEICIFDPFLSVLHQKDASTHTHIHSIFNAHMYALAFVCRVQIIYLNGNCDFRLILTFELILSDGRISPHSPSTRGEGGKQNYTITRMSYCL